MGACSSQTSKKQELQLPDTSTIAQNMTGNQKNEIIQGKSQQAIRKPKNVSFQNVSIQNLSSPINCISKKISIIRGSVTQFYSFKPTEEQNLIQHNITGQIRQLKTFKKDKQSQQYVKWLVDMQFNNPHVIEIVEIYEDKKEYQIVKEYIGSGLLSMIISEGPLQESICAIIMEQILLTINYLHSKQICHCRLTIDSFSLSKTSNDFFVKLTDLRSIYFKESNKFNEKQIFYLSPTVLAQNEEVFSEQVDFWAVGIIAWQLLTGKFPLDEQELEDEDKKSEKKILISQQYKNIKFGEISKNVSPDCVKFLRCLLSQNSEDSQAILVLSDWIVISKSAYSANVQKRKCYSQSKISANISYFQQCVLIFMISYFEKEVKFQIQEILKDLKINQNMSISKQQINKIYQRFFNKNDVSDLIKTNFRNANLDSGVSFEALLIASINKEKLLSEIRMELAYQELKSKQENISVKSLSRQLEVDKQLLRTDLKRIKDGKKLTFERFKALLQLLK